MNSMNMNGMNGMNLVGGVGGGIPMMSNMTNGASSRTVSDQTNDPDYKAKLNTYIYDYFLKQEQYDCAKLLLESALTVNTTNKLHSSNRINGVDDGDHDSKDDLDQKRPHGLPYPDLHEANDENSFLLEWFCLFWDMFFAARKNTKYMASGAAVQYVHHNNQQRLAQEKMLQQSMMRNQQGSGLMPNNPMYNNINMLRMQQPGGLPMNTNEMRARAASQNMRNLTPQQQQQMMAAARNQQMLQQQQQMERGGSDLDINSQRPRTPSSGDNAPSPNKRPRLDSGTPFPSQPMISASRSTQQNMQQVQRMNMQATHANDLLINAQGNELLMQNGINPNYLTQQQLETFRAQPYTVQEKSINVFKRNAMPPNGMNNQGSPMMQPGMDIPEYFGGNSASMARMGGPQGQPNGAGSHALQDYQMQLMLLEQQNKKRLLMARQEQDTLRPDGQPVFPPGMSPQGSRSGPSPNPNEQMKRGTPKINQAGLPGSPMPDGSGMVPNRGSPGPMNFTGQIPPEMFHAGLKMGDGMMQGPNGNMMRPPSSNPQFASAPQHAMEAMRQAAHVAQQQAQNGARLQNGVNWQQGQQGQAPMIPQVAQSQQPVGTPQQRNMPPPSGPPANATTNGRPASPSQSAPAPPTPQPANKGAPKTKKSDAKKRERPNTKNKSSTTAATPSSEADNPPPTPTPSTPITPMNPKTFSDHQKNGNAQAQSANGPTSVPAPAVQQPQQEGNMMPPFSNMELDPPIDMTFAGLDGSDVMEHFDFASFLQDDSQNLDFDESALNFSEFPIETGTDG